jgi:primosomal protein N' (replication factor Y) (superfamily II helicase)
MDPAKLGQAATPATGVRPGSAGGRPEGAGSRLGGKARASRRRAAAGAPVAADLPVARVAVDVPLAHLDRPFDYLVPERLAESAVPGCRVRVRFAGQLMGGYLLERLSESDHPGRLAALERVVSPEPVLTPEIAALAREVADRYAGTLADVLRLAIPPRHARVEAEGRPRRSAEPGDTPRGPAGAGGGPLGSAETRGGPRRPGDAGEAAQRPAKAGDGPQPPAGPGEPDRRPPAPARPGAGPWARYPAGPAFLAALADGRAPRAVWSALPGQDWPEEIARAAGTAAAAGRGTLIVVPDARDLSLVDGALAEVLGPGQHACLSADLGPAERYRRWLAVARGTVRVAAGTRGAMFAPVRDLGLVVVWDDGDDLHAEPRAPYPHAREVLALRAHRAKAGALIGGFARTAEATSLVASGWAAAVAADRPVVRRFAPNVRAAGDDAELARDEAATSARIPSLALRTARHALARGPVLVQVPRRGYLTGLACAGCRAPARCAACGGPLAVESSGAPARCRWCGRPDTEWQCQACGHRRVRAVVAGARRTAEELARAFPGARVAVSGGAATIASVPAAPALVVATPGAEPLADGGYAAAVLLDGWALLGRPSLAAAQEALRRWLNAAALVAPGPSGGTVILVADAALPTTQALIRWDPVTHAERELAERAALRFPPAVRMAAVTGAAEAVEAFLADAALPATAELIGPVALGVSGHDHGGTEPGKVQALIRIPRSGGLALAAALHTAMAERTARKQAGQIRIQLDPVELI